MADPAAKKQVVDVEFKASGLAKLKAGWADFAGDLLEPVAILAAGGTKAQALWAGMRGVFLSKVLGPLGMVAGAATGFLITTRHLVKEWRTVGVEGAKAIETMTLQFKPLLGSIDLAKKRAREVFAFGVKSPFRFAELAEGNKILQGLTKGALAGKDGMELVGDAAAVANEGFAETARHVGRLYDGLMSGRPVGEAAMRLQELGLISGETRNQIDSMQASNAAGSAIWAVVQRDIQRTKGAMKDLEESLEAMESTYEDTRQALDAGFGKGFLEGEKAGLKSATQLMERMTPTAEYLGETIGTLSNGWARLKARVVDAATGFPGFSTLATGAALAVWGLSAAVAMATGGLLAKFLLGVISASLGNKQLAASAGSVASAQAAQAAVTTALTGAQSRLALATTAVMEKQYLTAAAHTRAAAAQTVAAVRTNALAASQGILRGGLTLTGKAVGFVTRQLIAMAVAIVATPMFWISAALVAAAATMLHFHNAAKKAREELEAYQRASRAIVSNLQAQIREIRTVSDLRRAEADAVRELAQAHLDLRRAQDAGNAGQSDAAQKRIAAVEEELASLRSKPSVSLDKDQTTVEREDRLRDQQKAANESAAEFGAGAGAASEEARAKAKLDELNQRKAAAEKAMEAERQVAEQQLAMQRAAADAGVREPALAAEAENLRSEVERRKRELFTMGAGGGGDEMRAALKQDEDALKAVEAALADVQRAKEDADAGVSRVAMESDSELLILKEKVKLFDALNAASADLAKATNDAASAEADKAGEARLALDVAQRQKDAAEAAAKAAGIGRGFSRQGAEREIARIETQRTEDLNPAAIEEARQRVVNAELGLAQARIDAEAQVASLRLKGYEREKAMLGFERQKLQVAFEKGRVDQDSYSRQSAALDAQQEAMERAGREKGEELRAAFEISALRRREEAARRDGDPARAEALRAAAEARENERVRREAVREAEEVAATPEERAGYVAARMAEERAAREEQRKREEEDRGRERDRSAADQNSAAAELRARVAATQGRSREARRLREEAARRQDEVDRREKQKAYREQGFNAGEADRMAAQDVKTQQAQRLMEEMLGRRGNVVASSLAQVGGGGNVAGSDPETRLQERMVKLLEDVVDNTKAALDEGIR